MSWLLVLGLALAGREAVWTPPDDQVYTHAVPGEVSDDPWWEGFGDPALSTWIEAGLGENGDLGAAHARVVQARAVSWQQAAPLLPSVTVDATAQVAPLASFGFGFGLQAPPGQELPELFTQGSLALSARWSLDVWGRQLLQQRASRFDALAADGDRDAQSFAIASRISAAYWDVAWSRARVRLIEEQITTNEQLLEIVQLRYELQDRSGTDVLQQRQQLAAIRALLPQAQALLAASELQLEALVGGRAGEVPDALPEVPEAPSTGRPADLLDRRPDLRASAARLDAAHRRKLSAQRTALPTVGVSAQAGMQFIDTFEFQDQTFWNLGGSVSVPVFNGGATYHAVRAARAGEDGAARSFSQLYRNAIAEVEANATGLELGRRNLEAVRVQEQAARLAFEEIRTRYAEGIGSYINLITALGSWQQAQLNELQAHRSLLGSHVQLQESLGGRWTNR